MKVDRSKAVRASQDGHTYYFCSEHCRSRAGL
jgi:YHS domain-containing protein